MNQSPSKRIYIANKFYDWFFFILSPLWALLLGIALSGTPASRYKIDFGETPEKRLILNVLLGILINAHLGAVFLRSHANPSVFRLYPLRFSAVPILLYLSMILSDISLITISVLVVFWDVYHSSLQTFGLARIYDRNEGNDPSTGRTLDIWLNHFMYIGPIIGGATMLAHFKKFELFEEIGWTSFSQIPVFIKTHQAYFRYGIIAAGTLFLAFYLLKYRSFIRRGHRISLPKVVLLAGTGFCSIFTWGLNSFGQAFLIMNTFHAIQYLALVWHLEGRRIQSLMLRRGLLIGATLGLPFFIIVFISYGYFAEWVTGDNRYLWCIPQVVSIMHFWYDGFVWSVRKHQV